MTNRGKYLIKPDPVAKPSKDRMTKEQRAAYNRAYWLKTHPACPNKKHMGEHACCNRNQCWEPCGELGKSPAHAAAVNPEVIS